MLPTVLAPSDWVPQGLYAAAQEKKRGHPKRHDCFQRLHDPRREGFPLGYGPADLCAKVRHADLERGAGLRAGPAPGEAIDPCHGYPWYERWSQQRNGSSRCSILEDDRDARACLRRRLANERNWQGRTPRSIRSVLTRRRCDGTRTGLGSAVAMASRSDEPLACLPATARSVSNHLPATSAHPGRAPFGSNRSGYPNGAQNAAFTNSSVRMPPDRNSHRCRLFDCFGRQMSRA